jgi:uncharacterized membrane protein (UPF0127 family)
MSIPSRRLLLWLGLVAALLGAAPSRADLASFGKSELAIEAASGKHRFTIEEARTPEQMAQGLMFRRSMAADAGMLFEYPKQQLATFWMKNTLIPLDMLFIAADGRIATIHQRAVPLSTAPISSEVPVLAVLELNGGTVERLGLKPGDRVLHPFFQSVP